MNSFIRWAGSKRLLLPRLRSHWTGLENRYLEPFCGSACLFFDLRPGQAVLGDLNEDLICAYRAIKCHPQLVTECLRRFPHGEKGYYRVRQMDPFMLASAERAARFLYLNRYCFNGIFRTNLQGLFNVPYGPPKSGLPVRETLIHEASKALADVLLVHGDFETTLDHAQKGDFIYLDPPYCVQSRRVFAEYGSGSFAPADLDRLGRQLRRLHDIQAVFLVSYADCTEARTLLRPWHVTRVRARRHIAGFSGNRRFAYELLATNRPLLIQEHK
jgi:DNA adenine methylase